MDVMADRFAQAWREHRAYLVDLAFRMLGDVGDAQDVVQEAFLRLTRELDRVDDPRGWLTVVTSRLCLDQLRSARVRREEPAVDLDRAAVGDAAVQVGGHAAVDPADRVTLDDEVRAALHLVLDRLAPAERVAFVLHDVFRVPFEEVAATLGRPVATCRQLARRARQKVGRPAAAPRTGSADRELTEEFMRAATTGDLHALIAVLAPDAWGRAEFAVPGIAPQVNRGAEDVARNLVRFWGRGATMVAHPLRGRPVVLAYLGRDLAAVLELDIADRGVDGRACVRSLRAQVLALALPSQRVERR
jgi:RNA polymerase sigma-70 factor (ECF subfamily)